jgi:aquaporin Z
MPRYVTEFVGTFFLVLTIGLCSSVSGHMAAIAIGSVLMVMVYMGGAISGAHFNPAVTLAVFLRGKLGARELLPYWGAQILGATVAALAVMLMSGGAFMPAPAEGASTLAAFATEVLFTFALALVVLNVATSKATQGNSYFGLAIGFTVTAGAIAGGPISGGAFNPAVGIGPAIVRLIGGAGFAHVWLYIAGPLTGAAVASVIFRIQHQNSEDAPRKRVTLTASASEAPAATR